MKMFFFFFKGDTNGAETVPRTICVCQHICEALSFCLLLFQSYLGAARGAQPVHQVLHHWHGWRHVHLGCQGHTHTHTQSHSLPPLTPSRTNRREMVSILCLCSDSGVIYEEPEDCVK